MLTTQTLKEFDMSFQNLNKEELAEVAEFFVVDVEAADEENGPTKKELIAALAAGDEPVSWDDYKDTFLAAKEAGTAEAPKGVESLPDTDDEDSEEIATPKKAGKPEPVDKSDHVLVKYQRKNPTWEVVGYTFTAKHPFASVPAEVAEYLIRQQEGFRLALPSEVTEYYG